jgi:hypothetical protein
MVTTSPAPTSNRAGVVVQLKRELRFLPAAAVRRFVPVPMLSDVAGTGLTMALVDGQVLAILTVGPRSFALTVCEVGGQLVGLIGVEPLAVGFFSADGSGVSFHGQRAEALDVAELLRASVRSGSPEQEPKHG